MAGPERQRLLGAVTQLYTELGYSDASTRLLEDGEGTIALAEMISPEEEELVAELREGLARVASAVAANEGGESGRELTATRGALDGAVLVMRGEILAGNESRLAQLLPTFAFLVALPSTGREEALRVASRVAELLAHS